jgi:hypothetical protein
LANLRLTASPDFPQGINVGAYRRDLWAGPAPQPGDTPGAPLAGVATVEGHGYATFIELEPDTPYYVGAQVVGIWRWKSARTPPEATGGGGGGGGESQAQVEAIANAAVAGEAAARSAADATLAAEIAGLSGPAGLNAGEVDERVQNAAPVIARAAAPQTVSGSVTPDMSAGKTVFLYTTTGPVTLHPPTGAPSTPTDKVLEALVIFIGNNAITLDAALKLEGEPIPFGYASGSSRNAVPLISYDHSAWYAIGADPPAANVPQVEGEPLEGQALVFNHATGKWKGGTAGLSEAEVKALAKAAVQAEAVLDAAGGHKTTLSNRVVQGYMLLGDASDKATWSDPAQVIPEYATERPPIYTGVEANLTIHNSPTLSGWYELTKAGITLTLEGGAVPVGEQVIVQNASGGAIKVKGPIGSTSVITIEVQPGEVIVLEANLLATVWRLKSAYRSLAALEALVNTVAPQTGATTPTPGAEGEVVPGTAGISRRRVFAIVGDGTTTVWKLKHELGTKAINVSIQSSSAGVPKEQQLSLSTLLGASGKINANGANEVQVTFTAAPTAGTTYFVSVAG